MSIFRIRSIALLKDYLVQLRTRCALRKNDTLRTSTPYQEARSIGVLFGIEGASDVKAVGDFVQSLEESDKTVTVLALVGDGDEKKRFTSTLSFDYFTPQDVSDWGHISPPHVRKFIRTPFDYLYCIDRTSSALIHYLLAQSKALCRIGEHKPQNNIFFEMMIDSPPSTSSLLQTMYTYTKKIR